MALSLVFFFKFFLSKKKISIPLNPLLRLGVFPMCAKKGGRREKREAGKMDSLTLFLYHFMMGPNLVGSQSSATTSAAVLKSG